MTGEFEGVRPANTYLMKGGNELSEDSDIQGKPDETFKMEDVVGARIQYSGYVFDGHQNLGVLLTLELKLEGLSDQTKSKKIKERKVNVMNSVYRELEKIKLVLSGDKTVEELYKIEGEK